MAATLRLPCALQPQPQPSSTSTPNTSPDTTVPAPPITWLVGSWSVTHSTLPMWRKSRNVRITYTPIPSTNPQQINDVVSYQSLTSDAVKTVTGVDKPLDVYYPHPDPHGVNTMGDGERASLGYKWRGKGWLMIASSRWEILGWGDEEGTEGNGWVVTYFAKTLFTPAGVDFYSRKGPLRPETLAKIKKGLEELGGELAKLAGELFEVKMDGARAE
ncbi:hypothetical protein NX059_005943 [Plenodomus lindquistii]|nr:hypothetical protein NX059_005943 [Plenodomus lindquistii]